MENNQENKISADTEIMAGKNEVEVLELKDSLDSPEKKPVRNAIPLSGIAGGGKKKKYDFYVELVLFFILGILLGVALKNEAVKRITIGFNDYKMKIGQNGFNINQIEKDILQKQQEQIKEDQNINSEDNNNSSSPSK